MDILDLLYLIVVLATWGVLSIAITAAAVAVMFFLFMFVMAWGRGWQQREKYGRWLWKRWRIICVTAGRVASAVAVGAVAAVDKCSSNDNTTYEAINPENSPD